MDPRQHVNPGDPIRLAATQINGLNRLLTPQAGFTDPVRNEQTTPYTWVMGQNNSGSDVPRWGVLAISGMAISPSSGDNARGQFEQLPVVACGTPSSGTTAWCVPVEPIRAGEIGRVAVAGIVQCKLTVQSDFHPYVRCQASSESLATAWEGQARIIWRGASGYGSTGWALINLGQPHTRVLLNGWFEAPWPKDEYRPVTVETGVTYNVENPFASITGTGQRRCVIAYTNFRESTYSWRLISAECV